MAISDSAVGYALFLLDKTEKTFEEVADETGLVVEQVAFLESKLLTGLSVEEITRLVEEVPTERGLSKEQVEEYLAPLIFFGS